MDYILRGGEKFKLLLEQELPGKRTVPIAPIHAVTHRPPIPLGKGMEWCSYRRLKIIPNP